MCLVKFSNTTIGYWTQELGLSVYKESCSLFKDKRYALIVDESMMIGSEKLLRTLAMPAINAGSAITEKDITIVDISIVLKTEDIHPPKTGISVHFSGSLV